MNRALQRPSTWIAAAACAQAAGVAVLAALQVAAFVSPPSLGEETAVAIGYAVLVAASAGTCVFGSRAAYLAVRSLAVCKAVAVVAIAAPTVFVGVAELYATLAMLTVF